MPAAVEGRRRLGDTGGLPLWTCAGSRGGGGGPKGVAAPQQGWRRRWIATANFGDDDESFAARAMKPTMQYTSINSNININT